MNATRNGDVPRPMLGDAAAAEIAIAVARSICGWFTDFGGAKSFGESSQLLPYGIPLTMGSITVLTGLTLGWWSF